MSSPERFSLFCTVAALLSATLPAQTSPFPLFSEQTLRALSEELSGENAKRTVQELTLQHRMRGSKAFRAAAEAVLRRAHDYGLEAELLQFPADGKTFYGTQRSRPAWDAEFAELWRLEEIGGGWKPVKRIASWRDRPITLAQDSAGGEVTADLVDVGSGTSPADYSGKDVRGKLVLASSQPGAVWPIAVSDYGAAGIVSYAQNQRTAWWKEDETLVRWGHMNTFPEPPAFGFMVSLKQARLWQQELESGGRIRLHARVEAGQSAGSYDIVTAVIPGSDRKEEEIVFSCHLDHQRPGANDNASGCAAILEVARALRTLIDEGKIAPPRRTLRFFWPPEIEGTITLLNAVTGLAERAVAVIHMDMVGGGSETKALFHVTRSPKSLASFVNDVAEAFGRFVIEQSSQFAGTAEAPFPLVSPYGSKDALPAEIADFSSGSDHQVYTEGSFRIPAIYLNDWPDRYIHTSQDSVDKLDSTKLLRAAFIGAASGYYLCRLDSSETPPLFALMRENALRRAAATLHRARQLQETGEIENLLRFHLDYERSIFDSVSRFTARQPAADVERLNRRFLDRLADILAVDPQGRSRTGGPVYQRAAQPKGPMSAFGYSYLSDQLEKRGLSRPRLLTFSGLWGEGSDYAYETLNLVDGNRSVVEIRDALSAIYGPVPVELVEEFLSVLEQIGVVSR